MIIYYLAYLSNFNIYIYFSFYVRFFFQFILNAYWMGKKNWVFLHLKNTKLSTIDLIRHFFSFIRYLPRQLAKIHSFRGETIYSLLFQHLSTKKWWFFFYFYFFLFLKTYSLNIDSFNLFYTFYIKFFLFVIIKVETKTKL